MTEDLSRQSPPTAQKRPRIGLLLLTAEWFIEVGATQGSFRDLPRLLDEDAAQIDVALGANLDIVNPGVLATREQVRQAVETFCREDLDAVVACQITWGEDRLILDVVRQLPNTPLLLWCYVPFDQLPAQMTMLDLFRASGPVGAVQASGPLKRLGKRFAFAFGSHKDPKTIRRIVAFARAARLARDLQHVSIGVLPYRCDQMTGTYVDEFRLKREIGPELRYISTHDYLALCEQVADETVAAFVDELKTTYRVAPTVTEAGLSRAARVSLGLVAVAKHYELDAIAIEDVSEELHRVIGLRPCLGIPELFERAVVSMEAEVGGAVALLMLKKLTDRSPMYTEIFTFDATDNCILVGHAGIHDAANLVEGPADVLIEPDGEYVESEPDSAWMRFRVKGGRVTLLSVFCDVERFKLVIATGEALPGEEKLLGSPHAYIRPDTPLPAFFETVIHTGMTQHWALVHDDVVDELLALAHILDLECVVV